MDKYELGDDGLENDDNEDDADYDADTAYKHAPKNVSCQT